MSDRLPSESHPPSWEGYRLQANDEGSLREAMEHASDYRGDVTIHLKTGQQILGYVFDYYEGTPHSHIKMYLANRPEPFIVECHHIAEVEFSGEDTAFGRSWEDWAKKWQKPQTS